MLYPERRFLHLHASELGKLLKGLTLAKVRPLRVFYDEAQREWRIVEGGQNFLQYLPDFSMVLEIAQKDARPGEPISLVMRVKPRFALEPSISPQRLPEPKFPAYGAGRSPPRLPQVVPEKPDSSEPSAEVFIEYPVKRASIIEGDPRATLVDEFQERMRQARQRHAADQPRVKRS